MLDIENKIREIDNSVSETELFLEYGIISLAFYELSCYKELIVGINNERDKFDSTNQRMTFIPIYKEVYITQKKS